MSDPSSDAVSRVLGEIQAGEGLSLSAVGRTFPGHRGRGSVDPSTVFRWVTKGAKAADGRVVRLAAARVGGRWVTSRAAVARFIGALTAGPPADPTPPGTPAPVRRSASAAHSFGRYNARSTSARPVGVAYPRNTPTWAFSMRPCCRSVAVFGGTLDRVRVEHAFRQRPALGDRHHQGE